MTHFLETVLDVLADWLRDESADGFSRRRKRYNLARLNCEHRHAAPAGKVKQK